MRVIHHFYKCVLPQRLSVYEKNYVLEIRNVRMAAEPGPWGVVCGPTVTVQWYCCGAIKHQFFKGFNVAVMLLLLSAIN